MKVTHVICDKCSKETDPEVALTVRYGDVWTGNPTWDFCSRFCADAFFDKLIADLADNRQERAA